jgi:SpoVK/Ycf46/Vps4 family AAA+-type ATPase
MDDVETQDAVNNILNQLKGFDAKKDEQIIPAEPVTPDNLEKFVIDKASDLINKSLNMVDEFQTVLGASPSEESAEAMANLINAASSAIETLNKVLNSNKRAQTSIKIKEMDVESRNKINERDNATRLMMTRSEIMKILSDANKEIQHERVIEAESTTVN